MRPFLATLAILAVATTVAAKPAPFVSPATSGPPYDCSHFHGTWASETFNPYGQYTNTQTATYTPDGKLILNITIKASDGAITQEPEVTRDWYCDGYVYITRNDPAGRTAKNGPRFKVYQLLESTPQRIRYRTIVGHSPGIVYTLEREPK